MKPRDIRVRCSRQIHTIRMYKDGPIVLVNHPPDTREADKAIESLNGDRMFCYEVLEAFQHAHAETSRPIAKELREAKRDARYKHQRRTNYCSHRENDVEICLIRKRGKLWRERRCVVPCVMEKTRAKEAKIARITALKLAAAAPDAVSRIECEIGDNYWGTDTPSIYRSYSWLRVWITPEYYSNVLRLLGGPIIDGHFVAKTYAVNNFLMADVYENPFNKRDDNMQAEKRRAILYENSTGWHLRFPINNGIVSGISMKWSAHGNAYKTGRVGRFL